MLRNPHSTCLPLSHSAKPWSFLVAGQVLLAASGFAQGNGSVVKDLVNVDELRVKAEKGDSAAQMRLGMIYYVGQGVSQDYPAAIRWLRGAVILASRWAL